MYVRLPQATVELIDNYIKQFNPKHLAKVLPDKDYHVTLLYGLLESQQNMAKFLSEISPFKIGLGNLSLFSTNPEYDVLKIDCYSYHLYRLNNALRQRFRFVETKPSYIPHLTLGFFKKGMANIYNNSNYFYNKEFITSDIIYSGDKL